eukprot:CAMPEP_0114431718 /NCGR_PEP_ID=MMETSP0103-20121206/10759_1 /TAXON_ID=37642 ORGANISM="Paraphysomonas imperforata, Strain PA2" /NCGR_SAMPLE_ID=MMETSP0103 /ASSEMBLY_ACC=CAM_ASM_000201 /LENGTH=212 /DNA_ID=CAMNT_0001601321 /DNA_START=20 /DNA_END=658 /DNA_ORIENTATION=-
MALEVILGTSSFIRKKILTEMGFKFTVMTADLDEKSFGTRSSAADATALVALLARAKADAITQKIQSLCRNDVEGRAQLPSLLLTADSVATFEGEILEKPVSLEQAAGFLRRYGCGNPVSIVSGICVTNLLTGAQHQLVDTSSAIFTPFSQEAIDSLLSEGTVLKCAGGIIIEHPLVRPFIREIQGSEDGIQGLPKHVVLQLIKEATETQGV